MWVVIAKLLTKEKRALIGFRLMHDHSLEVKDVTFEQVEQMQQSGEQFSNLYHNAVGWSTKPTSLSLFPAVGVETKTKDNWTLVKYVDGYNYFCADRDGVVHTLTQRQFMKRVSEAKICNVPKNFVRKMIFSTELY